MLTPPAIRDERIAACLLDSYGLRVSQVTFLPLGADVNAAVYRVAAADGTYFLKLRRGSFAEVAVTVPAFLRARGIRSVMAPIPTTTHQLWARAAGFTWVLYPYFAGTNGFESSLSRAQWVALGESLKAVHTAALPAELAERVPREDYGPRWRSVVKAYHRQVQECAYDDPTAASLAAFWRGRRDEIQRIVERAERLARELRSRASDLVLCHSDLHGGNVLLGADDSLAIVDWDEPILAPKERDLMFVGGGVGGVWDQPREVAWFYEGYGRAAVDPVALAYYRYERIVADLAAYGEQILGVRGSAEDRAEGLQQLVSQFLPGQVVEIAHRSYPSSGSPTPGSWSSTPARR